MKELYLLLGGSNSPFIQHVLSQYPHEKWVGVDAGAQYLLEAGIAIEAAIGDFDSVSPEKKEAIQSHSHLFIELETEKDMTDSECAIDYCLNHYIDHRMIVYLPSKGRLDHLLANLLLPLQAAYRPKAQYIEFRDESNRVIYLQAGHHLINKVEDMTYVGLVSLEELSELTLKGFKYPLEGITLAAGRVFTSNEFIRTPAYLSFSSGMVMLIQSKDI